MSKFFLERFLPPLRKRREEQEGQRQEEREQIRSRLHRLAEADQRTAMPTLADLAEQQVKEAQAKPPVPNRFAAEDAAFLKAMDQMRIDAGVVVGPVDGVDFVRPEDYEFFRTGPDDHRTRQFHLVPKGSLFVEGVKTLCGRFEQVPLEGKPKGSWASTPYMHIPKMCKRCVKIHETKIP